MNKKGFTLIELLVVVAIIGVLASVVLASLNSARSRGADASVKSNLSNIRAQAEIVYDTDGDYDNVCGNAIVTAALAAADNAGGGTSVCNDSVSAWAASTALKTQNVVNGASATDYWCVDSNGSSKIEDAALGTATSCN